MLQIKNRYCLHYIFTPRIRNVVMNSPQTPPALCLPSRLYPQNDKASSRSNPSRVFIQPSSSFLVPSSL